jgi:hypothetical protein
MNGDGLGGWRGGFFYVVSDFPAFDSRGFKASGSCNSVATNATMAARKLRVLGLGKYHGVFQMDVTVKVGLEIYQT